MKKFLLIIAVATAGILPQVALCNGQGLVDSAKAVAFYQTKLAYPYVDPLEINPALAPEQKTGLSKHLSMKTLDCGAKALVDESGNVVKVYRTDDSSGIAN